MIDAGNPIRNAVLKQMHERNVSAWQLSQMCGVPYDTVRRFVAGTNDTSTTKASLMLIAFNSDHPDEKILVHCTKDPTSATTN